MVENTARLKDAGGNVNEQAACSRISASEMVGRAADRAAQIQSGAGYMREYTVGCFHYEVDLFRICERTTQMRQVAIVPSMIRKAKRNC